jgi:hypothetical protein
MKGWVIKRPKKKFQSGLVDLNMLNYIKTYKKDLLKQVFLFCTCKKYKTQNNSKIFKIIPFYTNLFDIFNFN